MVNDGKCLSFATFDENGGRSSVVPTYYVSTKAGVRKVVISMPGVVLERLGMDKSIPFLVVS